MTDTPKTLGEWCEVLEAYTRPNQSLRHLPRQELDEMRTRMITILQHVATQADRIETLLIETMAQRSVGFLLRHELVEDGLLDEQAQMICGYLTAIGVSETEDIMRLMEMMQVIAAADAVLKKIRAVLQDPDLQRIQGVQTILNESTAPL